MNFVGSVTNFGITTSAINEIAIANNDVNPHATDKMIATVTHLIRYISFGGMAVTLILSPLFSKMTFGNYDYTLAFIWLSLSLLLNQLTSGKLVVLQGLRKLRHLAKANLFGSIFGLILSFPLFYYFKEDAIVGSILIYSLSTFIFAWYFTRGLIKSTQNYQFSTLIKDGKQIIVFGFALGITGIISTLVSYLLSIFIAKIGGVTQLGLYNASIAITTSYSGIIFSAIATDYHPRLSALKSDALVKEEVNKQAEIALYFLGPLLLFFLIFCKQIVQLLYSKEFELAVPMIRLILIGIYFKLFSWAISFTFVARGRVKLFFWNELVANLYVLSFNILGYFFFGLIGLGLAIIISYFLYSIQVFFIAKHIYGFVYNCKFTLLFLSNVIASVLLFYGSTLISEYLFNILGTIILFCFIIYSLKQILYSTDLSVSHYLKRLR
jgi:O-antigen/teichoic acid export membrane protein